MGELKARMKELRRVRKCWSDPPREMTVKDCERSGCPYAGNECMEMAFMDAMWLLERLWRERKELKKRVERGKEQT